MTLEAGATAPDFRMEATGGRTLTRATFKARPFVLYFYPKADTSGCTKEACAFQEALQQFEGLGLEIVGVSKDPLSALEKFAAKYGLTFPLASDGSGVCEAYGVWAEKSMYGKKYMGIERTTFLIDAKGRIAQVWPKVKVEGHAKAVLAAIRAG